jgi:arylsulfatase A-like enzyme
MYDPAEIKLATNRFVAKNSPEYAVNVHDGEIRNYSGIPPTGDMPDDLARQLRHGYYAAISYTDAQIGRVMAELKTLGLDKNTIVVLWGDHGWNLGEHSLWGKHTNVENDVNSPLIISAPSQKAAGKTSAALTEFVDIYPTLCDLAGVPLPDGLEGVSLKPLMDNPELPWKTAAFSQYPRKSDGQALMGYSMRTDRYRFTVWVDRDDHSKVDAIELYDHQTDPEENTNVAKDPANAELVKSLMKQWDGGWQAAKPPAQSVTSAEG